MSGVRGTKLVLARNIDNNSGELYVPGGMVEVTTPEGETVIVDGGYRITFGP
ncbi:MAG: hypothetical protein QME28_08445 [Candidatus Saccharicenans sp.]|nr:hypothetical protein [Candidatus Saccharicenans sp.]